MAGKARRLVVGNWKMNGVAAALAEIGTLGQRLAEQPARCDVGLCLPATLLSRAAPIANSAGIALGGQDCHPEKSGAHTGDISAAMLADAGAKLVIVGHSERRQNHAETDALVCRKAEAALAAGLMPIICVGETEGERRAGEAVAVVTRQLAGSVPEGAASRPVAIAYEPVWAIGTGLTPTLADIEQMHSTMREILVQRFGAAGEAVPLLYGGSVKPANAAEILHVTNVDGALVGGASLLAKDFLAIISAA